MALPEYKRSLSPGMASPAEGVSLAPMRQVLDDWSERKQEREIVRAEGEATRKGAESSSVAELFAPSTRAGQAYNKAAVAAHAPQMELDTRMMRQEHLDAWGRGEFSGDVGKFASSLRKGKNAILSNVDPDARMVYSPRMDELINEAVLTADAEARSDRMAEDRATSDLALSALTKDLMAATQQGDIDETENLSILIGEFRKGQVEMGLKDIGEAEGETAKMLRDVNTTSHFGEFLDAEDQDEYIYDFRRNKPEDLTIEEHEAVLSKMKGWKAQADAEQVTQTADWIMTTWQEFTYAERLDMVTDIEDPAIKAAVSERVEREQKYERAATAERQYGNVTNLYEQIFVEGNIPTTDEIDSMPEEELSYSNKLMVKSWIDTGPDQMSDAERASTWYAAQQKVIRGEWDETDIMEQAGVMFDIRDAKSLVGFARNEKEGQAKLQRVQTELQAVYPTVWKNEKKRAQTIYGVLAEIERYEEETGVRMPGPELKNAIKDSAKGFVENAIFNDPPDVDALQKAYEGFGIDEPLGKRTAKGEATVDYWERQALRARRGESEMVKGRWPGAFWSQAVGVVVLGEREGEMHFIHKGKHKAMPMSEWGK